jgi:hypothetical protein
MFWWRSRALSKETRASSHACLRSSSARRSLICAPLTEGERTDADASCWRQDDRGLDLVEVECAMPSSRSTSSRRCFMAPGEAVELSHPVLEGKPNANHVRARISYSRTQQLHNMDIITQCSK